MTSPFLRNRAISIATLLSLLVLFGCSWRNNGPGGPPPTTGTLNVNIQSRAGTSGVQCTGSVSVAVNGPGGTQTRNADFSGVSSGNPGGPFFCSANTSFFPLKPGTWSATTSLCPATCSNLQVAAGQTKILTITCPDSTCQPL